jgi:hypothetical protein
MKINPNNYPVIIIAAFVIGLLLAFILGFRPGHGTGGARKHGSIPPPIVQTVEAWEAVDL